jgi:hypothetical protein
MAERPGDAEPVISEAVVAPGHDGQAVLVVRLRHASGAVDAVTLDAGCARTLMEDCGAESAADLRGHPWRRLMHVLEHRSPRAGRTEEESCSTS